MTDGSQRLHGVSLVLGLLLITAGALSLLLPTHDQTDLDEALLIPIDAQTPAPQWDGRLVYVQGELTTVEPIFDADFNISSRSVLLQRTLLMYQWSELVADDVPRYEKVWAAGPIDSDRFAQAETHANPKRMLPAHRVLAAGRPTLGAYRVSMRLAESLQAFEPLAITNQSKLGRLRVHEDGYFRGRDPSNPRVGDLKVQYAHVPPTSVSIVARLRGDLLDIFALPNDQAQIVPGDVPPAKLYSGPVMRQTPWGAVVWVCFVGGFVLLVISVFARVRKPAANHE